MNISAQALAATCAHVADERKAENVVVLEVGAVTTIADYFVIATGRNVRQMKALVEAILERLDQLGTEVLGVEGQAESGWILIDGAEVVVHLFAPETRSLYALEMLWGGCAMLDWTQTEPLPAEQRR